MAAAAYRAGVKLEDHRTAMVFDFTRRSGVMAAAILAPVDAGELARDRASLWNAAEAAEKRKDSRTAREWILALPSELDAEQRAGLARDFARELVDRYGVAADVAIHAPSRDGDDRNHHAHILCTTRVVAGGALGEKSELELSDAKRKTLGLLPAADEISKLRERWADLANAALEKAGAEARIDHRSLAAQQGDAFERGDVAVALTLEREPQQHVGVHATQQDRRAGQVVSLRGQARATAVAAAHRAALTALRQAPILIEVERENATAVVRAGFGPVWAESGAVAANDTSDRADAGPVCADTGTASMNNTHDCAESGPAHHERAESGTPKPQEASMIQWPKRPRPVVDVEDEITRLSRSVESRLDEAFPDRRRAREAAAVAKWREAEVRNAQELIAAGEAEVKEWDRAHRWRALLDRSRLQQSPERRALLVTLQGRRDAQMVAEAVATAAKREASRLATVVQQHARTARPAAEAAAAVDAAELPRLREELEKSKAFEVSHAARQHERARLFQRQATEAAVAPGAPAPAPDLDPAKVAAFEAGRVERMGPEHSYQAEFNAARRAGLVVWNNVAIRGTAAALAHNTVGDVRTALAGCWPGDPACVEDLLQEGRAQRVVDQVREAIEAGAEPATRAGAELVARVVEYGQDDAKARTAVAVSLDACVEALACDPALCSDQEKDRPAPRLG